jgi:hypothetical protein
MTAYFHSVTHPLGFGVYASIATFAIALTRLIAVSEIGYNACGVERKFGMPAHDCAATKFDPERFHTLSFAHAISSSDPAQPL